MKKDLTQEEKIDYIYNALKSQERRFYIGMVFKIVMFVTIMFVIYIGTIAATASIGGLSYVSGGHDISSDSSGLPTLNAKSLCDGVLSGSTLGSDKIPEEKMNLIKSLCNKL